MTVAARVAELLSELEALYDDAVGRLREALRLFVADGTPPDPERRRAGLFGYPELRLRYRGLDGDFVPARSFGRLNETGEYAVTVTRPAMFRRYLTEQLTLLIEDYGAEVEAGTSAHEIPYPYVLDRGEPMELGEATAATLGRWFPTARLSAIGDEVADGLFVGEDGVRPLALFDGPRTDFSLARLAHYTGTPPEHTQRYVLFTNYHRYVDEFVQWAVGRLGAGGHTELSCAGGVVVTGSEDDPAALVADSAWRRHQMPAWHLRAPDRAGITLVNIGVGPSNAKTITDHLAVLRPEAWLMIGHCGGLRPSQRIGDYVLAHAYLRDDHVLDEVLPPEVPIPAIAEVQQALTAAASDVSGQAGEELKRRLRTGTVVTTDDRNWELRFSTSSLRFSQSRAVGIDMESATIAAQGYRFRVPYGTLLCVSDKPLHGELKLPGQANRFYERAISEHLRIGIRACERLRDEGDRLHSRKLRAFTEPPFR